MPLCPKPSFPKAHCSFLQELAKMPLAKFGNRAGSSCASVITLGAFCRSLQLLSWRWKGKISLDQTLMEKEERCLSFPLRSGLSPAPALPHFPNVELQPSPPSLSPGLGARRGGGARASGPPWGGGGGGGRCPLGVPSPSRSRQL